MVRMKRLSYSASSIFRAGPPRAAITSGPDGAVGFTGRGNNTVGRVAPDGAITIYSDTSIVGPWGIATGPDGRTAEVTDHVLVIRRTA